MPMLVLVSDIEEFNSRLRVWFRGKIIGLLEGELVKKLRDKLEEVSQEIAPLALLLKKPKSLATYMELSNKKEGNARIKELIERRISEFNSAMGCLLDYLDGKVLMLKGGFNWNQIYWMIKRECRRLDDGLPIHADRKDILWQIHRQQPLSSIVHPLSLKNLNLSSSIFIPLAVIRFDSESTHPFPSRIEIPKNLSSIGRVVSEIYTRRSSLKKDGERYKSVPRYRSPQICI